ncbi:MAG TPA: hypothetical protein VKU60_16900 [Chloroflexota bacterium]|nr:hypothetical protein [Chloroflexota bacterium]
MTRSQIQIRGLYGGIPTDWFEAGRSLADYGVNGVWIGSGSLSAGGIALLKRAGAQVFAEFNTLHEAGYVAAHPDSAPVGADGQICPPPDGWQGACPTHSGYRQARMDAFHATLRDHEIDGIWLDYHHSHASWEQETPNLPDTCFCARCLARFAHETGLYLPAEPVAETSRRLLGELRPQWTAWRCDVFTDWVREFRAIVDAERPGALLGTFHCPWTGTERGGALREKLAIDLKAQAPYLDVFSTMPYHARFGHADDPAWISRSVVWLGEHLGLKGEPGERHRIWPIVQLADWGESVPVEQVAAVLDHATRAPATGVIVFAWSGLRGQPDKVEEMGRCYRQLQGMEGQE